MTTLQVIAIWIVVIGVCLFVVINILQKMIATNAIVRRSRNGSKMVANAKNIGAIAFRKNSGNTFAICLRKDFLKEHYRVREERPYSAEFIKVRSTFTFWKDEYFSNPFHIASVDTAEKWLNEMIYLATGFHEAEVDRQSFEEAVDILIPENFRLYLPFVQKGNPDKDDLEFYDVPKEFILDIAKLEARIISAESYLMHGVRQARLKAQ